MYDKISRTKAQKKFGPIDSVTEIEALLKPKTVKVDFNAEVNYVLSKKARLYLQHGGNFDKVLPLLQHLDRQLTQYKLTEKQAKDLITDFQKQLEC